MEKWKHATMDSKQAYDEVMKTVLVIDNSGPIYRGDNLDMIQQLDPIKRKSFYALRHRLAKAAILGHLRENDIYKSFQSLLK